MPNRETDSESLTRSSPLIGESKPGGTRAVAFLQSVSAAGTLPRSARTGLKDGQHSSLELLPKNFFVTEQWHRPYAHALMEKDPTRLAPLVAEAEHAIFGRYLELSVSPASPEYFRDLQNAIDVLIKLKTSTALNHSLPPLPE
jgi:hypothetical protein